MRDLVLLAILLLEISARPAVAAGRVSFTPTLHGVETTDLVVALRPVRSSGDRKLVDSVSRIVLKQGQITTVDLEEGNWTIEIENLDLWFGRQNFYVARGQGTALPLDVWPRSALVGRIATSSATPPREMLVRFESVGAPLGPHLAGEERCPIERDGFRCTVPAGHFQLRLRPRGFIGHYRADVPLAAGGVYDLGTMVFQEGQSITGRIDLPRDFAGDPAAIAVEVTPAMAASVGAPISGAGVLGTSTAPEKNGFFHVDAVATGAYVVRATYRKELVSEAFDVLVRAGRESELIEPLRLRRPRQIRVEVLPPATPAGRPWHIKASRYLSDQNVETVTESNALGDGTWESPRLQPGTYDLSVGTVEGDVWRVARVEVGAADQELRISLEATVVHGSVVLGDRPLQAALTFADSAGLRINAASDEKGRFSVALPRPLGTTFDVAVESDAPPIQRHVRTVHSEGDRSLDIRLPNLLIAGEVVDDQDLPVEGALVSISGGDSLEALIQPETSANGRFEAHGLAPGTYSVMASGFLQESDRVTLKVDEGDTQPVRLVLRDMNILRGRITSGQGGIPGASVHARAADVDQMMSSTRSTDADGAFGVAVPAGARAFDVTVAAPGFGYMLLGAVRSDRSLSITLEQRGGTLVVQAGAKQMPYLVHNGGTAPITAIGRSWPLRTQALEDGSQQFEIAMMDPGSYSACLVEPSRDALFRRSGGQAGGQCVQGFLPPFGAVTFDMRSLDQPAADNHS